MASISERQVKLDQRKAEDTQASNRQSDLEKDFAMFFDGERLDACEAMLSMYQNKEDEFNFIYYPRLACIILEVLKYDFQVLDEYNYWVTRLYKPVKHKIKLDKMDIGLNDALLVFGSLAPQLNYNAIG